VPTAHDARLLLLRWGEVAAFRVARFTASRGAELRVQNFRRACFDRAAREVGLDGIVRHELRHTAASRRSRREEASGQCKPCILVLHLLRPCSTVTLVTHSETGI
jgi:hypothetical protein